MNSTMRVWIAVSLLIGSPAAVADELPAYLGERAPLAAAGREHSIQVESAALGASREVLVRTPVGFDESKQDYGVVYVLDATWLFPLVADHLEYLQYWGRIPPLVVVGVPSADRNADLVPWADPYFANTGQGDGFRTFLHDELRPLVHSKFRGDRFEVLIGHSFGGVMVLNSLFADDAAFDAWIAIGSSVWVSNYQLREQAQAYLESTSVTKSFLHLAVAEHDGGATVPSNQELADLLEAKAPGELEWAYEVIPATNHFTAVMPALHNGLERLFPGFDYDVDFAELIEQSGAEGVSAWFAEQRRSLGYRFWPQRMELTIAAFGLAAEHPEGAMQILLELEATHADDPEVAVIKSRVASRAGSKLEAVEHLREAISMAERVGYYPSRIASFRARLERLRAAAAD